MLLSRASAPQGQAVEEPPTGAPAPGSLAGSRVKPTSPKATVAGDTQAARAEPEDRGRSGAATRPVSGQVDWTWLGHVPNRGSQWRTWARGQMQLGQRGPGPALLCDFQEVILSRSSFLLWDEGVNVS